MPLKYLLYVFLMCISYDCLSIEQYRGIVESASKRYGIHPSIPMAIIKHESRGNPNSLNIDGEGFYFSGRAKAEQVWKDINKNPWMVKVRLENNEFYRGFFLTEDSAMSWANRIANSSPHKPRILKKKKLNPSKSEIIVRKIYMKNTDLGLGQTNYIYHGQYYNDRISFFDWLDPGINIDYTTRLLSKLIRRHKDPVKAMGYYHNKNPNIQSRYLRSVLPLYNKEVLYYEN